ncbi:hypothetical protein SKAU_G00068650 [Synaphobranchus kaupii]|uniref:Uncharacterized protein n=1 Tax=Synaphobranchus kaupii TaxID=118154 RepID=A0A9Q1G6I2_SYNKA|nr:hypothetical protein SKAU_G00068650 [Synaphobranchus kaupii]
MIREDWKYFIGAQAKQRGGDFQKSLQKWYFPALESPWPASRKWVEITFHLSKQLTIALLTETLLTESQVIRVVQWTATETE